MIHDQVVEDIEEVCHITRTTTLTQFWSYLPYLLNLVQAITLQPFEIFL